MRVCGSVLCISFDLGCAVRSADGRLENRPAWSIGGASHVFFVRYRNDACAATGVSRDQYLVASGFAVDADRWSLVCFWGVGIRLFFAGMKQTLQPEFTAKEIFKMKSNESVPIIKELGVSNLAGGIVGIASAFTPAFVLPIAIYAAIFYAAAGVAHVGQKGRSAKESLALWTDLLMAVALLSFVAWSLA